MSKQQFRERAPLEPDYPTWQELSSRRAFLAALGAATGGALLALPGCKEPEHTAGKVDTMVVDRGPDALPDAGPPDAAAPDTGHTPVGPEGGLFPPMGDLGGPAGSPPPLDAKPPDLSSE